MKKLFILLALLACGHAYGQKIVEINFNQSDFHVYTENSCAFISSSLQDIKEIEDTLSPHLPYIPCRVIVPEDTDNVSYSVSFSQSLLLDSIDIEANPAPVIYGTSSNEESHRIATQSVTTPIYDCGLVKKGVYKYIYLKITPFLYNKEQRKLYFVSHIQITFPGLPNSNTYTLSPTSESNDSIPNNNIAVFINDNEIDGAITETPNENTFEKPIEYLIITNSNLSESFTKLKKWKEKKAIPTFIITTDSIEQNYPGIDIQEKIKRCIEYYHTNFGTQWVLLGGDASVVPTKYCRFFPENTNASSTTPADIYYACFKGTFNWDADGDGIAGELYDGMDFNSNVYISRIPARTSIDVEYFTEKLIAYEQGNINPNRLLLAGYRLFTEMYNGQSDAHYLADLLYNKYIEPYWNGPKYALFDTYYWLPDHAPYNYITDYNLIRQINNGYNFILMNTHGSYDSWRFGLDYTYQCKDAEEQTNFPGSIIVTSACETNWFDDEEDCLSKSFINNPDGGAIAYWGSSREGFGDSTPDKVTGDIYQDLPKPGKTLKYSDLLNAYLFRSIFTEDDNRWGVVTAKAKEELIEECRTNDANRALLLSNNPMGDPEMCIYTATPKSFLEDGLPMINVTDHYITISTLQDSCTISLLLDNGKKVIATNTNSMVYTSTHIKGRLAITKKNYIPFTKEVDNTLPKAPDPFIIAISPIDSNHINISVRGADNTPITEGTSWNLKISNIMTGSNVTTENIVSSDTTLDTSGWNKGIYLVQASTKDANTSAKISIK
ncbi:MAG: T9SS type A sorting domain-containing protein [Prevotella sp.]|nr:T9SS type A sorting domain-containing protein [Prevotella sp.]